MSGRKRVTLREVAQAAGVGKATAHRVLHDDPHVAPETREKVLAAARALGWSPDPALQALSGYRWRRPGDALTMVLLILASGRNNASEHNICRDILSPVAADLGYRVVILDGHAWSNDELRGHLRAQAPQALLILNSHRRDLEHALDGLDCAIVEHGNNMYRSELHQVSQDVFVDTWTCLEHARACGDEQTGVAILRYPDQISDRRRWGAVTAYEAWAIPPLGIVDDGAGQGFQVFRRWFERHQPKVVVGLAAWQIWWLLDLGLRVPEDCGFCCCFLRPHQLDVSGLLRMDSTSAQTAIYLLHTLVQSGDKARSQRPIRIALPSEWNLGRTLIPLSDMGGKTRVRIDLRVI